MSKKKWIRVALAVVSIAACSAMAIKYAGSAIAKVTTGSIAREAPILTSDHDQRLEPHAGYVAAQLNQFNAKSLNQLEARQLFVLGSVLFCLATAARLLHRKLLDIDGQNRGRSAEAPATIKSAHALRPRRG